MPQSPGRFFKSLLHAYAAEVPLGGPAPGRYSLRVTVNDRASKATAAQRLTFVVK